MKRTRIAALCEPEITDVIASDRARSSFFVPLLDDDGEPLGTLEDSVAGEFDDVLADVLDGDLRDRLVDDLVFGIVRARRHAQSDDVFDLVGAQAEGEPLLVESEPGG